MGFLKRLGKNLGPALAGVATLVAVGFKIANGHFDYTTDLPAITAGIGLITAKGNTTTGGTVEQDGGTVPLKPQERSVKAGGSKQ